MNAPYTPGPWEAEQLDSQEWRINSGYDPTIGHLSWNGLAHVYGCDDRPEKGSVVAAANARLIAAAPDLLAALRAAALALEWFAPKSLALVMADQAINQATKDTV